MFYAQHGEDKKLVELLGTQRTGFYIDVGAHDPTIDSVTKHFYDKGWHGINIEPGRPWFEKLEVQRWRDKNLNVALSSGEHFLHYYYFKDTGLSTLDADVAQKHRHLNAELRLVNTRTLARICERYVSDDTVIDFLKIDVEGHEAEVLRGGDWDRYRPTILCIEGTVPLTCDPSWEPWIDFIVDQGYDVIDMDGLNVWLMRNR